MEIGKRDNDWLVVKNSIYGIASSVFGQVIAMLTSIVMGRLMGVRGVGSYTFSMTFAGIVYMFLNLGLGGIFQRNISRDISSAEKHYANALTLRLFFSLPGSFILSFAGAFLLQRRDDLWMLILACLYTGLTGIFTLMGDGVTAIERFNISFWFSVAQKVLIFITTTVSLYFTGSMVVMLVYHALAFGLLIIAELLYVNDKLCRIHLELDFSFCRKLLRESVPTILGAAAEYTSLKSDLLVLSILIGDVASGLYSVSSNIYIAASFVPLAMAKAATPTFNRMHSNGEDTSGVVKSTIKWMITVAAILVVGIYGFGKWGIVSLWGAEFEAAAVSLKILSISLFVMPFNRFFEYLLVGLNQQMFVAKCSTLGAIFNITANFIFVPILGMNAVAVSTIVTEFMVMAMELRRLNKYRRIMC